MSAQPEAADIHPRPVAVEVVPDGIPAALVNHDQWLGWRWERVNGKWTKPPLSLRTLGAGSSTDAQTWVGFSRAVTTLAGDRLCEEQNLDGLGFAITKENGITGVDLDDCVVDGALHPAAAEIIDSLASYAEISPSGKGVRIIVEGSLPEGTRNKTSSTPWGGALEVYDQGRYLTITGRPAVGTTGTVEPRQEQLEWLIDTYLPRREQTRAVPASNGHAFAYEVIDAIGRAKNAPKFQELFEGGLAGKPSPSEAVQALLHMLLFYTDDATVLDAIMRKSAIVDGKWDSKRGDSTWGANEIEAALRNYTGERYDWTRQKTPSQSEAAPDESPTGLVFERLSEVEMRSIVFVDKPLLQAAAFHLVAGRKGVGKGTLLADWVAKITRGELGTKRNVIWIGSEDSAAIDIKPRIVAAGGKPEHIIVVKSGWVQLPRDIDEIRQAAVDLSDVGAIIIDPVGNHITGKNSNSETDIRDAIAPLNDLADDLDTMIFGIRHLSEKECSQGAIAAILGSSAWVQVPRAVLVVVKDAEDPRVSHIQCVAGNRLPPETPGRMFRIEGKLLPGLDNEVTHTVWLGDSTENVEKIITKPNGPREHVPKEELQTLILEQLKDGAKPRDYLNEQAEALGVNADQVYRHGLLPLKEIGRIRASKPDFAAGWQWQLEP